MTITLLAAMDRNGCIGKDNSIPWKSKEDFKHFFEYTSGRGKILLMGRKTWESLPDHKLPGRYKIVLSKTPPEEAILEKYPDVFFATSFTDVVCGHLQEIFDFHPSVENFELIVIGGANIFSQFINVADQVVLTRLDLEVSECDAFFPDVEELGFLFHSGERISDNAVVHKYKYRGKNNASNKKRRDPTAA